jgi:hypothetical protein
VSTETTEKWMQILFEKRYVNFLDYYCDQIEFKTKKAETQFKKDFKEMWLNKLKEYQEALKKAKSEEAKEEIRKNGIKRKVDSSSNSKKKSKKK